MSAITKKAAPRLHEAMARSIGADPEAPGIRAEIARRLSVDKSRYSRVMKGREVSLDKLLAWMRKWNEVCSERAGREGVSFQPIEFSLEDDEPVFAFAEGESVELTDSSPPG